MILDAGGAAADPRVVSPVIGRIPDARERARRPGGPRAIEPSPRRAKRRRLAARITDRRLRAGGPDAAECARGPRPVRRDPATHALYGLEDPTTADFGRRCLLARRLLERGVRFVQVWSGAGGATNNWDNHNDIPNQLPPMARSVDRPIAALLRDLKARGLMEDTLVVFSTEFGRQPFTQGATGRDHNGGTSIAWLAGAGIKGGAAHGESDPWAWRAAAARRIATTSTPRSST